jgi:hypothetical protein
MGKISGRGMAILRRQARPLLILGVLAVLGLSGGPAGAERLQDGNLIVSLNGGISPNKLPRDHSVPVAVYLEGGVHTADGSALPRVDRLKLELAWRGELMTQGLAVCPRERLRGTASGQAIEVCGGALVGRGKLAAKIFVPGQEPFGVRANLLAFNGRTKVGRRAVLVHAYTSDPPISFVIPFVVHRGSGAFHTVLVTTIRRSVGTWPHVASFRVDVGRSFLWRGKKRSYLNASCPLPPHFTSGFLSFARATYTFAGGDELTTESVRSCRAREPARSPVRRRPLSG